MKLEDLMLQPVKWFLFSPDQLIFVGT
jgi:hypothetical protein